MSVLLSEGGEMKKLADMNLVYDFLAYSLTAHKRYGEEASRFILECIPQRRIGHLTVVPQKVWHGKEPKSHGVRIDIYLDEEGGEIFVRVIASKSGMIDSEPVQSNTVTIGNVMPDPELRIELIENGNGYEYRLSLEKEN